MNTATSPRDLIVQVIAEADKHLHTGDHYEQQADAVLAVVGPEFESLLGQVWKLKAQNSENLRAVGVALAQVGHERDVARELLRGMARRTVQYRRALSEVQRQARVWRNLHGAAQESRDELAAELKRAAEDWQRNDEQTLAENQRLSNEVERLRMLLARQEDKPSPWFTPAEFPTEQHEREDREGVQYASDMRQYLLGTFRAEEANRG